MSFSTNINRNKRNLLIYNNSISYLTIFDRNNDFVINRALTYNNKEQKRKKRFVANKYNNAHLNNCTIIKAKNKCHSNLKNSEKFLKTIKIFDDINNNNFNIDIKTIEHYNYNRNKNKKILKRYNTFKNLNNNKNYQVNKPPLKLKSELFHIDRKFLKEISPINKFISINKMVNEYKNKYKKKLDDKENNFYININLVKERKNKKKLVTFNYNSFNHKFSRNNDINKNERKGNFFYSNFETSKF